MLSIRLTDHVSTTSSSSLRLRHGIQEGHKQHKKQTPHRTQHIHSTQTCIPTLHLPTDPPPCCGFLAAGGGQQAHNHASGNHRWLYQLSQQQLQTTMHNRLAGWTAGAPCCCKAPPAQ